MRVVQQKNCIISGILTLVVAMFFCVSMMNTTARANVCFLPDDSACDEGDTFWPGKGLDQDGSICDASYNSTASRNACGDPCTKCTVQDSPNYGLYKCPAADCNCDGFNSSKSTNECGDRCERCTIAGARNYGKYKCPVGECPCPTDCNVTKEVAEAINADKSDCRFCEPCNNQNCADGMYRCANEPDKCWCVQNGYDLEEESKQECTCTKCEVCPKDSSLMKCGIPLPASDTTCDSKYTYSPSSLQSYTNDQRSNHCDGQCDNCCDTTNNGKWHCDCLGYDFRKADCTNQGLKEYDKCSGINGDWYKQCCNECSGYTYENDITDAKTGWNCTKCDNACPNVTKKYKCICSPKCADNGYNLTTQKTGDGWTCEECKDCDGTRYKCECKNGYVLKDGNCELACEQIPGNCHFSDYASCMKSKLDNNYSPIYPFSTNYQNETMTAGCVLDTSSGCYIPNCCASDRNYDFQKVLDYHASTGKDMLVEEFSCNPNGVSVITGADNMPLCYHCNDVPDEPVCSRTAKITCKLHNTTSENGGTGYFTCDYVVSSCYFSKAEVVPTDQSQTTWSVGGEGTRANVHHLMVSPATCKFYYTDTQVVQTADMQSPGDGTWSCSYTRSD